MLKVRYPRGSCLSQRGWVIAAAVEPAPHQPPAREPTWIRDGLRSAREELRLFFATAIALTLHPVRFGAEWAEGRIRTLNPLGYFITSLALFEAPLPLLFPDADNHSLPTRVLNVLGPYLNYLALGAIGHAVLRLMGSRRGIASSIAMVLFSAGGPVAAVRLILALVVVVVIGSPDSNVNEVGTGLQVFVGLGVLLELVLFYGLVGLSFRGLHQTSRGRVVLALVAAFVATGLFFGYANPPGSYGLHPHIRLPAHFEFTG